jgi:methyltransferase (TIGR00027 family)
MAGGELDPDEVDGGAGFGMARMTGMMAVRTRLIDDYFADAGAAGVRQVVILASGLDARAYRLPWASGTTVFEIDQPAGHRVEDTDTARTGCPTHRRAAHRCHRPAT